MFRFLLVVLIIDSLILGTIVLLQAGKGGGLAALGGGASTDSFLGGRQATTILTKMSWWCGGIFLGLSLALSAMSAQSGTPTSVLEGQVEAPSPVQLPRPAQPGVNILQDSTGN